MILEDWYSVIRFPENFPIEAIRISNTSPAWLCLHSYRLIWRNTDST